jgi:hypothetical protein
MAKYKLILELTKTSDPTDVFSTPGDPNTRRIESGTDITSKVIETDSLAELKAAMQDFRQNLKES